jgi:hypothetical protein
MFRSELFFSHRTENLAVVYDVSTQIIPVNYSLLLVNVFVASTGLYQINRFHRLLSLRLEMTTSTGD